MKPDSLKAARRLLWDVEKHCRGDGRSRKDAVLHLRIEGEVMERIKAEAAARNLSVSDLVRGHLAEHFAAARPEGGAQPAFLLSVAAFSKASVTRESPCAACGVTLVRGVRAFLAHGPFPAPQLVCGDCHGALQQELETRGGSPSGEA